MSRDQSYSLSATRPSYMKQSQRTCSNGLRASAWLRPEAPSSPWNTKARNTRSVSHTPPPKFSPLCQNFHLTSNSRVQQLDHLPRYRSRRDS